MKKIIKNNLLGFILGAIIFGSIGVVATNYLLEAKDIEYVDKDNNSTTVQSAITDLYDKAKKGGFETLSIGTVTKAHNSITIPYTGSYVGIYCLYGTNNNYESLGTINGNTCTITGLQPETSYNYKIIASDSTGKVYEGHGTIETDEGTGPTMQTTNLVSTTGTSYRGLLGIVYLNPTDLNESCDVRNSVSATGTKTGCMRWYAYLEDTANNTYTMILDHNTTATVPYNTENTQTIGTTIGNIGYDLALLTTSTSSGGSGWNSSLNPRLITADEIAQIVGNTDWNPTTNTDLFYFDSKTDTQTATSQGASAYAWLFDYTKSCISYGCNISGDNSIFGYWTSTKYAGNSSEVLNVYYGGKLFNNSANATNRGLRPVITVSASILSIE